MLNKIAEREQLRWYILHVVQVLSFKNTCILCVHYPNVHPPESWTSHHTHLVSVVHVLAVGTNITLSETSPGHHASSPDREPKTLFVTDFDLTDFDPEPPISSWMNPFAPPTAASFSFAFVSLPFACCCSTREF